MKRTPLRYRLLLIGLVPLIVAGLLHQVFVRHKGDRSVRGERRRYLIQRSGLSSYRTDAARPVWLHAASVGEVNAVLPLLPILFERRPELRLVITTNTVTGALTVRHKLSAYRDRVHHFYLPVDWRFAVRRFLDGIDPAAALIVETELWPNLYAECAGRGIPVCLINARLSKKTLDAPGWLRPVLRHCLRNAGTILARGEADARQFIELGADTATVNVTGNIKFAAAAASAGSIAVEPPERPYVLAASTHEGEETLLADCWQSLDRRGHLLAVAPRYPARRNAVRQAFEAAGLRVVLRSDAEPIAPATDVYLIDTLGELGGFIPKAAFVFMGGSLVPRGGQNVLEAAKLGKAVITGPHTFTFEAEIDALQQADGIVRVDNADQLKHAFGELLADPARARQLGDNARRLCEARAGIAETYADALERLGFLSNNHGEHGAHGDKK